MLLALSPCTYARPFPRETKGASEERPDCSGALDEQQRLDVLVNSSFCISLDCVACMTVMNGAVPSDWEPILEDYDSDKQLQ